MARLTGVCVLTENVRRLADFYAVALNASSEADAMHAAMDTGVSSLSIFSVAGMEALAPGSTRGRGTGGYLLEFAVPNVDGEYERLRGLGVAVVKAPTTYPWGRRAAWFRDCDGNLFNLYTATLSAGSEQRSALDPRETVRAYFERVLSQRDLSLCDSLLAPDYVDHDAPPDAPCGPEPVRAYLGRFLAEYPDLRVTIEDMVAAGDRVVVRCVWTGTHGVTGVPYHLTGIAIIRVNSQGQMVERWSAYSHEG